MNIVEFLDSVGHTRLRFQVLHDCISGATRKRGFTEVRFGTSELDPSDLIGNPRRVGFVVWMDRADYDAAREAVMPSGKASETPDVAVASGKDEQQ